MGLSSTDRGAARGQQAVQPASFSTGGKAPTYPNAFEHQRWAAGTAQRRARLQSLREQLLPSTLPLLCTRSKQMRLNQAPGAGTVTSSLWSVTSAQLGGLGRWETACRAPSFLTFLSSHWTGVPVPLVAEGPRGPCSQSHHHSTLVTQLIWRPRELPWEQGGGGLTRHMKSSSVAVMAG